MDVKKYLQTEKKLNLARVASEMWPDNKTAKSYLSNKLSDKRPWTKNDNDLALSVLKKMGVDISRLTPTSNQ